MARIPRRLNATAGFPALDAGADSGQSIQLNSDPISTPIALARLKLIALDCDGVLWIGEEPLEDAAAFVSSCKTNKTKVAGITNNSGRGRKNLAEKAARLGIPLYESEFYTSNFIAGKIANERFFGKNVLVIGSGDLKNTIGEAGAVVHEAETDADKLRKADFSKLLYDAVMVGYDRDVTYAGICHAVMAVRNGARFISTNPDYTFPAGGNHQVWPGNGAIVDLISRVSGFAPEVHGKPDPELLLLAMKDAGSAPGETLMVGDRVSTDIQCGKNAGAWTCLMKTGIQAAGGEGGGDTIPDIVALNLDALLKLILNARNEMPGKEGQD